MPGEHAPFASNVGEHMPFLPGGGGGGVTLAEVLEILHGVKEPKTILKAALSEEINELLGKGGPPSGPAGGVLAGLYPNPELKAEAVTTAAVKLLAITTALLGEEAVSTLKLAAKAVTSAKIAAGAILAEHLGAEAVTTAAIKLLAITTALLGEESVTEPKLAVALREKLVKEPTYVEVEELNASLAPSGAPWPTTFQAAIDGTGRVRFRGALTCSVEILAKSKMFKLPEALRPESQREIIFLGSTATLATNCIVKPTGEVENLGAIKPAQTPLTFDICSFQKIG